MREKGSDACLRVGTKRRFQGGFYRAPSDNIESALGNGSSYRGIFAQLVSVAGEVFVFGKYHSAFVYGVLLAVGAEFGEHRASICQIITYSNDLQYLRLVVMHIQKQLR